ncbi:MAG: MBL fold metallo-hydrolase [Thermoanaerobaculia bacterium]
MAPRRAHGVFRRGELAIEGVSLAGDETWFRLHPPGLALDAGRGSQSLAGTADLFLSHGHLDHALGVPYLLSQRTLHHRSPTRVFCPAGIADDLRALVAAAGRLERIEYRWELVALEPGDRCELGRGFTLEAFATDHVVPGLGAHLLRTRKRLRPGFVGLEREAIAAERRRGVAVEEEFEELWLSYCGDTGAGVWESAPAIDRSRVLMLECTFLGEALRGRGAAFGHLHFDDLVEHRQRLAGHELVVLHHLSRRHHPGELRAEVDRRLPELAARIHVWGEPGGSPGSGERT